ncbi:DUF6391 domain-containing protein [Candidatus Amarolinea dominans]|uniref:DUF6391 domain-containing protein n=1 Tax=Candidatus Amarolinea dominans TaxID=3140696 RepID=UPI001D37561B|nr:hypothetical protein [Anaerolineae bacterium]MBK7201353.1 hypothetical protein [Anaerolineae bacterium]MBK9233507.1 hypothetical protein [Anaerolineae bacterium]
MSIVRRNHGIEHATVSLLTARRADRRIVARSNTRGFIIFGEIETQELELATKEALRRLQAGDAHMAVHPNCGTNFVTSGMLAGLAAWAVTVLSTQGERKRSAWEALPTAFTAATLALFVAQPLGHTLQEFVTTSAQVQGVRLGQVTRRADLGGVPVHLVELIHP